MKQRTTMLYLALLIIAFSSCTGGPTDKSANTDSAKTNGTSATNVRVENNEANQSVDIYFGDELFTSYIYPDHIMKPSLWPVVTSRGTEVTRKFPMKEAAGDRVDHPHHVGIWMNYGDINGIDYWGHSEATPAELKSHSGIIRHQQVLSMKSGEKEGSLSVKTEWSGGGIKQINEEIAYRFIDKGDIRIIDWISTLTAQEDLIFNDTKEGMFAIRVSRELELPSDEPVTLTDDHGDHVTVEADNSGLVSGDYLSSEGITGIDVWGTRARWMKLFGNYMDEKVALVIIDHKNNPGYPVYWHARGYGLFAVNALGQEVFSEGKEVMNLSLKKGESTQFAYRMLVCSGAITGDEIEKLAAEFSKN